MKRLMTPSRIAVENIAHTGTGGRSQENSGLGFAPAFFDFSTCATYRCRFADGRDAPFHCLDGLPDEVVIERAATGKVLCAKHTLLSGFVREGYFYTRRAASRAMIEWTAPIEQD